MCTPQKKPDLFLDYMYLVPKYISNYCSHVLQKLSGMSPRANYTDRATASCR
jgi:hypothetical protein